MDFSSPAACRDQLQRLHPIDIPATHATLTRIVEGLLDAKPAPNLHLEVLEAAREVIAYAQHETARRYAAQPLPPDSEENRTLLEVVKLGRKLSHSYAQIARVQHIERHLF